MLVFIYAWSDLRLLARHVDLMGTAQISTPSATALLPGSLSAVRLGLIRTVEVLAPLVAAISVGFGFAEGWDDLIRFLWAQPFGETEPLYGHDIAFYLFKLPFLERIQNTVALLAFAATAALLVIYVRAGLVAYRAGLELVAPRSVLHHLLANAALFLLAWASGYILDRYELLTKSTGAVFGAGYTAVHVTSWALWAAALLTVGFVVLAYAVVATGRTQRLVALASGFVAAMVLILVVLPTSVQRFAVLPNELALEEPYLRRDIAFTRKAFGLAAVEVRAYVPSATLDTAAIEANRDTINNIRLWDWQPLKQTFRQLQQIRSYYTFEDVDVDRYRVGDSQRQVLLAARELSRDLPGKGITWVNRRLQYTHGYGLVMAPAADKTPDGRPVLIIADIPPVAPPLLGVTQPAIYYGEEDSGYRIVNTSVPEFDYPSGDENVYASYQGHGDVVLDGWLKQTRLRLAAIRHQYPDLGLRPRRQPDPALAPDPDPHRQDRAVPDAGSQPLPRGRRWAPVLDPGRLHHRRALSLRRAHRQWRQLHPQLGQDRRRRLPGRRDLLRRRPARSGAARLSSGLSAPVAANPGHARRAGRPPALSAGSVRDPGAEIRHLPHDRAARVLQQRGSLAEPAREGGRPPGCGGALLRPDPHAGRSAPGVPAADADDPRRGATT